MKVGRPTIRGQQSPTTSLLQMRSSLDNIAANSIIGGERELLEQSHTGGTDSCDAGSPGGTTVAISRVFDMQKVTPSRAPFGIPGEVAASRDQFLGSDHVTVPLWTHRHPRIHSL